MKRVSNRLSKGQDFVKRLQNITKVWFNSTSTTIYGQDYSLGIYEGSIPSLTTICLGTRIKGTSSFSRIHTSYVGRFEGTVKECMVEVYPYCLPVERRMDWNESSDVEGSSPSPSTNFGQGICLSNPRSRTSLDHQGWDDSLAVSHCSSQCPTANFTNINQ